MNYIRIYARNILHLFQKSDIEFLSEPMLPAVESEFLKKTYLASQRGILEYGSGGSTLFAIKNGIKIISVESDKKFLGALNHFLKSEHHAAQDYQLLHADIGVVGKYGMPFIWPLCPGTKLKGLNYVLTGYSGRSTYSSDVIFVDGRWRVACCLYALLSGVDFSKTVLLIDDYELKRKYNKLIEKYFTFDFHGRLAKLRPNSNPLSSGKLLEDFICSLSNPC